MVYSSRSLCCAYILLSLLVGMSSMFLSPLKAGCVRLQCAVMLSQDSFYRGLTDTELENVHCEPLSHAPSLEIRLYVEYSCKIVTDLCDLCSL